MCCDKVLCYGMAAVASIARDSCNGHAPVFGIPENIPLSSIIF